MRRLSSRCSRPRCGAGWVRPVFRRSRPAPTSRARCERCATAGSGSPCSPSPRWSRARRSLQNAGLREHFEHVLSASASGAFKPEDLAYRAALEQLGAPDAWFVTGHWWDVAGATFAGLRTARVSRTDFAYPVAMPEPHVRAEDVAGAARAILDLPRA